MLKRKKKQTKLLFCINSLSTKGGGAEKILSIILKHLEKKDYQIDLITFDKKKTNFFYKFPKKINIYKLGDLINYNNKYLIHINRIIILFIFLKRLKPSISFGFMHSSYVDLSFASIFSKSKIIACEHIVMDHFKKRKFELFLIYLSSIFINKITVVSSQVKNKFSKFLQKKMISIENFVDKKNYLNKPKLKRKKIILSVGRIADQKNYSTLIKAFHVFNQKKREWKLVIIGEGYDKRNLIKLINDLNLKKNVKFLNFTKKLNKLYKTSSLYVCSSIYESLGLTVAEALINRLPCIGFKNCDGVNKLIKHNKNGILINGDMYDYNKLGQEMINLTKNKNKIKNMINYYDPNFLNKNSDSVVLKKWLKLIKEMTN